VVGRVLFLSVFFFFLRSNNDLFKKLQGSCRVLGSGTGCGKLRAVISS